MYDQPVAKIQWDALTVYYCHMMIDF
jgi:hypothetical protein